MSAARRLAPIITLALTAIALTAAVSLAQVGSPNPSGGTGLRPAIEEGTGSISLAKLLSFGLSIDLGLRGWISTYAASRFIAPAASRPVAGHTLSAAMPRRAWGR